VVNQTQLTSAISTYLAENQQGAVLLKADRQVSYEQLARLLSQMQAVAIGSWRSLLTNHGILFTNSPDSGTPTLAVAELEVSSEAKPKPASRTRHQPGQRTYLPGLDAHGDRLIGFGVLIARLRYLVSPEVPGTGQGWLLGRGWPVVG
jgi:hypothetical protein